MLAKAIADVKRKEQAMDTRRSAEPAPAVNHTTVERASGRELVATRMFNAPARLVFDAWTRPELFRRWWTPQSFGLVLLSCDQDVRVGGRYRLVFSHPAAPNPMEFFGTYLEVIPHARLVWTNEEGGDGGQVTTVTFEETGDKTLLVMHDLYPTKEALDEAMASGSTSCTGETFEQLDAVLDEVALRHTQQRSEGDATTSTRTGQAGSQRSFRRTG